MSGEGLLVILVIGLIAGWLAGTDRAGHRLRSCGRYLHRDRWRVDWQLAAAVSRHSSGTRHHRCDHHGNDRRCGAPVDPVAHQQTRARPVALAITTTIRLFVPRNARLSVGVSAEAAYVHFFGCRTIKTCDLGRHERARTGLHPERTSTFAFVARLAFLGKLESDATNGSY
jgi:hypothetical protein